MKAYHAAQIRNVGIVGHGGEGKTTLTEAMLFAAGHIDRMGKTDDGSTVTDYDPEETRRQITISAGLAPIEWKNHKINVIDAPGYFDFEGEVIETLSVVEAALIVVGAVSGLSVGTEKTWKMCKDRALPRAFVVNRMDTENANFQKVLDALIDKFGASVAPAQWPIMQGGKFAGYVDVIEQKGFLFDGAKTKATEIPADIATEIETYRGQLIEAAAENDEELMEKFFGGEELSKDEIVKGLGIGLHSGTFSPVFCTAAPAQLGVAALMDNLIGFMPAPNTKEKAAKNVKDGSDIAIACDESKPFSAQIFKTLQDNFVGKISLFKVYSGKVKAGDIVYNVKSEKTEKISAVLTMRGKKTAPLDDAIYAGDIGAVAKLQNSVTGDTLCDNAHQVRFDDLAFPNTAFTMAVSAKKSGEEDKVFGGLNKLLEEDPTFKLEKRLDTGDMLISGLGEMHLDVITSKLKNKFNVEAKLDEPTVPYRETIRKSAKAQGRHKKQSGGHGQFGDVWVEFEPIFDGSADFEFVDKIVGGVVPRNFIPAVEKGLRDAVTRGVLAGFPTINIRCTLFDGSYHAVDSNEMAFRTAARIAYKKGVADAGPVLLEPIYRYEVYVPDEYMGDIIGDMNRRRGRIMGMNPTDEGQQVVAEAPLGEMFKYATDLRSMTQGRGRYDSFFERYEEMPANIAQKVIEKSKKDVDEDDE